jgi:outer membrane protein insertion porin family
VNFSVVERPSGSLSAGIGFSQSQGFIFNTSISQQNFLGSGKYVSLSFNNSAINTIYSFGYTNPYYTIDGISRGFNIYYRKTNPTYGNIASYSTNVYGGDMNFGIPVTENDRLLVGFGYQNAKINLTENSPQQFEEFVNSEGSNFDIFNVNFGWSRDRRDNALLPTSGGYQNIFGKFSVPIGSLQFYEFGYRQSWYHPLTKSLVLMLNGDVAYGNVYGSTKRFPFFENFYAGGIHSVRGFKANTLGPKAANGTALGGNFKVVGNIEVFFPVPFAEEFKSVRLSTFIDAGNIYGVDQSITLGELRYSAGVSAVWLSPFGTLQFSVAKALNVQPNDIPQVFQFSMGTSF